MTDDPRLASIEERIAVARANIAELIEQATAFSGAANEERNAERIADQERELASLTAERDAILNPKS